MIFRKLPLFLGCALVTAVPALAQTTPPPPPYNQPPPQQHVCPAGTHWEEAGYVGHGKWREARCARDDGRE